MSDEIKATNFECGDRIGGEGDWLWLLIILVIFCCLCGGNSWFGGGRGYCR